MENIFSHLNESQCEAVRHIDGPSLVIAGAGSGKTRVLTYKIAYLLSKGIPAWNILALTFTNKAAAEMKERVAQLVGEDVAKGLHMGTFHSIFAKILRIESNAIEGYDYNYTILDTEDVKKIISSIVKNREYDKDTYKPSKVLGIISKAKNDLITAEMYANSEKAEFDAKNGMPYMANIYLEYAAMCRKSNSMDFDDLLLLTNVLFRNNPHILQKYQSLFKYILVDEYQDTNICQYQIIKQLAKPDNNLCVVGDDAQSIYSFRGAKIENILGFSKDYPDYRLFKLERNYRSTKTIVNAANSLIKKNKKQIPKTTFSELEEGDKITLLELPTDAEEGVRVASRIAEIVRNGDSYDSCAILYRTHSQSRILEEALNKKHIPCKIVKGMSFFQRKEVKDVLSYARVILNPYDEIALRRIVNYPGRGIGDATVNKISELAQMHNISMWGVMRQIEKTGSLFAASTIQRVLNFVQLMQSFMDDRTVADAYSLLSRIVEKIGIKLALEKECSAEEAKDRFDNVLELLNGAKEFVEQELDPESIYLQNYMEKIALLTDIDEDDTNNPNKVLLMTVHAAKGLEFKHCFLVGMEENLFPSAMSMESPSQVEEERRLFYVALTRAMKTVTLSYAQTRRQYGNLTSASPSRFLSEIDAQYIAGDTRRLSARSMYSARASFGSYEQGHRSFSSFETGRKPLNTYTRPTPNPFNQFSSRPTSSSFSSFQKETPKPFSHYNENPKEPTMIVPSDPVDIRVGQRVAHQKFGMGMVKEQVGNDASAYAIIAFDNWGDKKLLLKYAKLQILEN